MNAPYIPQNHQQVIPYLILRQPTKFLLFTKEVFDAKELDIIYHEDKTTIMHAEIMIGDSVIMFASTTEQYAEQVAGLFIYVDDADAHFEKALAHGARSIKEPSDECYGRSSGILDPCGNTWWITKAEPPS